VWHRLAISPLEGEMPGRAEGGIAPRAPAGHPPLSLRDISPSRGEIGADESARQYHAESEDEAVEAAHAGLESGSEKQAASDSIDSGKSGDLKRCVKRVPQGDLALCADRIVCPAARVETVSNGSRRRGR